MGRGRAKAKQTKVARDLKYNSPNTDLSALQAELGGSSYVPSDATRKSTATAVNSRASGCESSVTIALPSTGGSTGVTLPPPFEANRVPRASVTVRS